MKITTRISTFLASSQWLTTITPTGIWYAISGWNASKVQTSLLGLVPTIAWRASIRKSRVFALRNMPASLLFFYQFLALLACLCNERDHSTLMAMAKRPVFIAFPPESPEVKYAEVLTPYATTYVHKQLALRSRVDIEKDNGVHCEVASSNGQLNVTVDSCQCTLTACTCVVDICLLFVSIPLFSSSGVDVRWTRAYLRDKYSSKREGVQYASSSGVCLPQPTKCYYVYLV